MTKFIKTLIIINGILFPLFILILLISFLIDQFRFSDDYRPDPVMTENIITRDGDTLMAQGLSYLAPEDIYNSTNLMIKVKPKTYEIPKTLDLSSPNFEGGSLAMMMSPSEYYVNVLFLNSDYSLITRLVDKKASIESIIIPKNYDDEKIDTTVKNIAYLIAFEDSNKDKLIDSEDNYDLFISDLNGQNLTQVSKNVDIEDIEFIKKHTELFISFTDRDDNILKEHRIKRFAIYNIESKSFKILHHIDKALNDLQNILLK